MLAQWRILNLQRRVALNTLPEQIQTWNPLISSEPQTTNLVYQTEAKAKKEKEKAQGKAEIDQTDNENLQGSHDVHHDYLQGFNLSDTTSNSH